MLLPEAVYALCALEELNEGIRGTHTTAAQDGIYTFIIFMVDRYAARVTAEREAGREGDVFSPYDRRRHGQIEAKRQVMLNWFLLYEGTVGCSSDMQPDVLSPRWVDPPETELEHGCAVWCVVPRVHHRPPLQ